MNIKNKKIIAFVSALLMVNAIGFGGISFQPEIMTLSAEEYDDIYNASVKFTKLPSEDGTYIFNMSCSARLAAFNGKIVIDGVDASEYFDVVFSDYGESNELLDYESSFFWSTADGGNGIFSMNITLTPKEGVDVSGLTYVSVVDTEIVDGEEYVQTVVSSVEDGVLNSFETSPTETSPEETTTTTVSETSPEETTTTTVSETSPEETTTTTVSETSPEETTTTTVSETSPEETTTTTVSETSPEETTTTTVSESSSLVIETSVIYETTSSETTVTTSPETSETSETTVSETLPSDTSMTTTPETSQSETSLTSISETSTSPAETTVTTSETTVSSKNTYFNFNVISNDGENVVIEIKSSGDLLTIFSLKLEADGPDGPKRLFEYGFDYTLKPESSSDFFYSKQTDVVVWLSKSIADEQFSAVLSIDASQAQEGLYRIGFDDSIVDISDEEGKDINGFMGSYAEFEVEHAAETTVTTTASSADTTTTTTTSASPVDTSATTSASSVDTSATTTTSSVDTSTTTTTSSVDTPATTTTSSENNDSDYLPGDLNYDGRISAIDLVMLKEILIDKSPVIPPADVNQDGKVSTLDLLALKEILLA